jgi:lactoylglutathione lyase
MVGSAVELLEELWRRTEAGDGSALDELVAVDLVNHAAGPQGREGLKQILAVLDADLGAPRAEHHHLFGAGDLATHHVTLHGTHVGSTMPLLEGMAPSGKEVAWTFVHVWRAESGLLVEHWACRDDLGLLVQLGAWPTAPGHHADGSR